MYRSIPLQEFQERVDIIFNKIFHMSLDAVVVRKEREAWMALLTQEHDTMSTITLQRQLLRERLERLSFLKNIELAHRQGRLLILEERHRFLNDLFQQCVREEGEINRQETAKKELYEQQQMLLFARAGIGKAASAQLSANDSALAHHHGNDRSPHAYQTMEQYIERMFREAMTFLNLPIRQNTNNVKDCAGPPTSNADNFSLLPSSHPGGNKGSDPTSVSFSKLPPFLELPPPVPLFMPHASISSSLHSLDGNTTPAKLYGYIVSHLSQLLQQEEIGRQRLTRLALLDGWEVKQIKCIVSSSLCVVSHRNDISNSTSKTRFPLRRMTRKPSLAASSHPRHVRGTKEDSDQPYVANIHDQLRMCVTLTATNIIQDYTLQLLTWMRRRRQNVLRHFVPHYSLLRNSQHLHTSEGNKSMSTMTTSVHPCLTITSLNGFSYYCNFDQSNRLGRARSNSKAKSNNNTKSKFIFIGRRSRSNVELKPIQNIQVHTPNHRFDAQACTTWQNYCMFVWGTLGDARHDRDQGDTNISSKPFMKHKCRNRMMNTVSLHRNSISIDDESNSAPPMSASDRIPLLWRQLLYQEVCGAHLVAKADAMSLSQLKAARPVRQKVNKKNKLDDSVLRPQSSAHNQSSALNVSQLRSVAHNSLSANPLSICLREGLHSISVSQSSAIMRRGIESQSVIVVANSDEVLNRGVVASPSIYVSGSTAMRQVNRGSYNRAIIVPFTACFKQQWSPLQARLLLKTEYSSHSGVVDSNFFVGKSNNYSQPQQQYLGVAGGIGDTMNAINTTQCRERGESSVNVTPVHSRISIALEKEQSEAPQAKFLKDTVLHQLRSIMRPFSTVSQDPCQDSTDGLNSRQMMTDLWEWHAAVASVVSLQCTPLRVIGSVSETTELRTQADIPFDAHLFSSSSRLIPTRKLRQEEARDAMRLPIVGALRKKRQSDRLRTLYFPQGASGYTTAIQPVRGCTKGARQNETEEESTFNQSKQTQYCSDSRRPGVSRVLVGSFHYHSLFWLDLDFLWSSLMATKRQESCLSTSDDQTIDACIAVRKPSVEENKGICNDSFEDVSAKTMRSPAEIRLRANTAIPSQHQQTPNNIYNSPQSPKYSRARGGTFSLRAMNSSPRTISHRNVDLGATTGSLTPIMKMSSTTIAVPSQSPINLMPVSPLTLEQNDEIDLSAESSASTRDALLSSQKATGTDCGNERFSFRSNTKSDAHAEMHLLRQHIQTEAQTASPQNRLHATRPGLLPSSSFTFYTYNVLRYLDILRRAIISDADIEEDFENGDDDRKRLQKIMLEGGSAKCSSSPSSPAHGNREEMRRPRAGSRHDNIDIRVSYFSTQGLPAIEHGLPQQKKKKKMLKNT